ncbi:MAG: ACP S-malonyltransferase [Alphaproteobacteria bacterium]|nr:ACP S-malonyltransferase [Alphaproteobacteria bacterium]
MSDAFVFPGQGSQSVGMASAFTSAYKVGADTMAEIEDALSFNLSDLIENGSIEELTKTENAQPAIFAVSMICVRILEKEYGYDFSKRCKYLAGHSLGEYSALCTAGVFSLADAAKIVQLRGRIMSNAFPEREKCAMVALLGVGIDDVEPLLPPEELENGDVCVIANDNSNTQVVVSGYRKSVLNFVKLAKSKLSIKMAIELNTSGPFHSSLMGEASLKFDQALSAFIPQDFKVPVIMNLSAKPLCSKEQVSEYMVKQMCSRVRWRETTQQLVDDTEIDQVVEVAPGRTLSKMLTRSFPDAKVLALDSVSEIEKFINSK